MNLLTILLLACGDEAPPPFFGVDTGGPSATDTGARGPMSQSRIRVRATFRYDEATGLPGLWLDESLGSSRSAIEFLVGDEDFDGANGQFCRVYVPILPEASVPFGPDELGSQQYWGASLIVDPASASTNCDEPEYQRIWDFYGGRVTEWLVTDLDGSVADYALVLEAPLPDEIDWLAGSLSTIDETEVFGAQIRLTNRWPNSRAPAAAYGLRVDETGLLLVNDEGANVPIPSPGLAEAGGIEDGVYIFLGYLPVLVRRP